jgi:hypothetical protein
LAQSAGAGRGGHLYHLGQGAWDRWFFVVATLAVVLLASSCGDCA